MTLKAFIDELVALHEKHGDIEVLTPDSLPITHVVVNDGVCYVSDGDDCDECGYGPRGAVSPGHTEACSLHPGNVVDGRES